MVFWPVKQESSQIFWSESSFFSRFYFFISAIFPSISQNHMQIIPNALTISSSSIRCLSSCLEAVKQGLCEETDLIEKQKNLLAEMEVLEHLMHKAVMEKAETAQDQEVYAKRYDDLATKHTKLKKQYADAQAERQARQDKTQILEGMIDSIRSSEPTVIGFDAKLWNTTVDHVTVNRDDTLVFTMRDGREIRIKR